MSLRLPFLLLLFSLLTPLWGQIEMVVQSEDSVESIAEIITDSIETPITDSLVVLSEDSLYKENEDSISVIEAAAEQEFLPSYMFESALSSWRRNYPFTEPLSDVMRAAKADSLHPSALRLQNDSIQFDPSLSYAQLDLRMPMVMDGSVPESRNMSISQLAQASLANRSMLGMLVQNPFSSQLDYATMRNSAVYQHSLHNLRSVNRVRDTKSDLPTERKFIDRQGLSGDEHIDAGFGLELEEASLNVEQITFHADKWHRKGTTDLQVSQTALSEKWYKGGDNNMTLATYDKLVFSRYDESKKTTLDITLELRLSGYYTKADTIHPMRVNDNQFRADVSYGYKAWKNWYYSSTAYLKTPIFEYFNANSKTVKSNFFAPLELNVAVGMDLKLTQQKSWSYSLMLAPLSYNLKYVADERVNVTSYGIKANRRQLNQIGASITSKLEWKISESLAWSSRAYVFTSYHNMLFEFENTFNVKVGRYSTAKIYLYPRFDDSLDDEVLMKEMLTFGLAFAW